jgi:hypothetical protein
VVEHVLSIHKSLDFILIKKKKIAGARWGITLLIGTGRLTPKREIRQKHVSLWLARGGFGISPIF